MRMLLCLIATLFFQANAAAAAVGVPPAPSATACSVREVTADSQEIDCPLIGAASARRYRLQVHFSGGHDDTSASMSPTLDGAPLACDAQSKLTLFAEDGDVSLHCTFAVPAKPGARYVMRTTFTWNHAQYTRFEFAAAP
jgi:hypothetical protein